MKPVAPARATLRSVADAAGVSVATASRVMAGKSASPRAIAAVRAASRRLDYRPDPIARAMRAGATGTLGVVIPELGNPFFADLVASIEEAAHVDDIGVLVADSHGKAEREAQRIQTLLDRRVDGILIAPADEHASAETVELASTSVSVVQVDRFVRGLDVDYVGVDNRKGMADLLGHLEQQGCRTVAFVSSDTTNSTARARSDAFEAEAAERSLSVTARLLGDFSFSHGRRAAQELAAADRLPDAIVCGSDVVAVGLVTALPTVGLQAPRDLLVTGFDDIVLAELVPPGITTMRQPLRAIAREAVTRLLARVAEAGAASRNSTIHPTLVVRGTTVQERA